MEYVLGVMSEESVEILKRLIPLEVYRVVTELWYLKISLMHSCSHKEFITNMLIMSRLYCGTYFSRSKHRLPIADLSGMFIFQAWLWIPVIIVLIPSTVLHLQLILTVREQQKIGQFKTSFYRLFVVQVVSCLSWLNRLSGSFSNANFRVLLSFHYCTVMSQRKF